MKGFWMVGAALVISTANALDMVRLQTGEVLPGKVEEVRTNSVKMTVIIRTDGGEARGSRTLERSSIVAVDFTQGAEERELLKNASASDAGKLESLLSEKRAWYGLPNSPTGEIALRLAHILAEENREEGLRKALALLEEVIARDWNEDRRRQAQARRLHLLVSSGRLPQAKREVEEILAKESDESLSIEARYVMGLLHREALRRLGEEHPRWREDDEVRPERERLFHAAVDAFLHAHVFHGSREEQAARGLWAASELYRRDGLENDARAKSQDIITFYPNTKYASMAKVAIEAKKASSQ